MKRYLIHYSETLGTLDLVPDGRNYFINHIRNLSRRRMSVREFEQSEFGRRLWPEFRRAMLRAELDRPRGEGPSP